MDAFTIVTFVAGIALLMLGAELLVRGAAGVAVRVGLSSVVIGLTVVSMGTSAPELAVSVRDALDGAGDLAVGNVVGSNIANILLILGVSAAVGAGLVVAERIVRIDVPLMVGVSLLVLVLALDGRISRFEGALLVVLLVVYVTWTVRSARREGPDIVAEHEEAIDVEALRRSSYWVDGLLILAGLAGLVVGAQWLVSSATTVATEFGASELVIGLTVVALGTSMPELATSVVAVLRGQRDIAVGNAVGSNLFNLLGVLGVTAAVASGGIRVLEQAQEFDLPVMTAVAVACLPVFFNGYELKRWEGFLFVGYYVAYTTYLLLDATDATFLDPFRVGMVFFVLPLTTVTLVIVGYRSWKAHRRGEAGPAAAASD